MLTKDELAAMRKRLDATTLGPWQYYRNYRVVYSMNFAQVEDGEFPNGRLREFLSQ